MTQATAKKKSSKKSSGKIEKADWYDYPQYFDMVFRDETADEVDFFELAFKKYGKGKINKLLEPGCGSGRLVTALASKGYDVTGLDLSPAMLRYLDVRLKRRGLNSTTVLGDMTEMKFAKKFDAAFCTFNTFRHLLDEASALKHLRSMGQCVRKGGLYILGFHIIPMDADPECIERWSASHGGTDVKATLRVLDFDRKNRQETLRVSIKAEKKSGKIERIQSEFPLRVYTAAQAKRMLGKVADVWEIAEIFDFDYDIEETRDFDNDLTDALFVLRRK